jgi:poly(3-hydroxybutyrate) depolymerase
MKTWKQCTARLCLVLNVLLLASSSYATSTPPAQATMYANFFTPTPTVQATTPGNYITRVFIDAQGMQMTYFLFIPSNYHPQKKYPLVLLLHGGDERANVNNPPDQNRNVLLNQNYVKVWGPGIPGLSSPDMQARYPSFIVVPQVDNPQHWVDVPTSQGSYTLAAQPTDSLRMAKEIVGALQKQYPNIDPHRLYITGLSMGGYGTWDAIERWPGYFAAAAPLAGAGDPSKASRLVKLPIWAFHGSGDGGVPVSGSRDMIQAIKGAGGHPRYTEYAGAGHEIWAMVYSTPAFFSWLFSQRNSYPRPASADSLGRSAIPSLLRMVETWFHTILRRMETWFGSLLRTVETWLNSSLRTLEPWFGSSLRMLEIWFSIALRMVEIWFDSLLRTVEIWSGNLLKMVGTWLGSILRTVEPWLSSLLRTIERWLGSILRTVEPWLNSILKTVEIWFGSLLKTIEIWLGSILRLLETWLGL